MKESFLFVWEDKKKVLCFSEQFLSTVVFNLQDGTSLPGSEKSGLHKVFNGELRWHEATLKEEWIGLDDAQIESRVWKTSPEGVPERDISLMDASVATQSIESWDFKDYDGNPYQHTLKGILSLPASIYRSVIPVTSSAYSGGVDIESFFRKDKVSGGTDNQKSESGRGNSPGSVGVLEVESGDTVVVPVSVSDGQVDSGWHEPLVPEHW